MEGDSSTTDTTQLGITGEYMTGGTYVLQTQDDDGDESFNDHEDGNGSKDYFREQDIYLPIANVARIMKNAIPQTGKCSLYKILILCIKCVQECVSEFISFITSEASERCHQEKPGQLPAGLITADGQQQNVMVYTTSYQQIPGVQQIQFS
uniref:Nuclear transcription factor Y subunit beta n=1 Tax=Sinocyclocheilus rhinocerous TaxID=307959 RepID=A0A673JPB8_9TELE